MNRRNFLAGAASIPALTALDNSKRIPEYRVVTKYKAEPQSGMPGPYPGMVVTVHSPKCIDAQTEKVDVPSVKEMIARGMTTLTGDQDPRDSWARFFNDQDFVGIKINCSGAPGAMSMPDVVAEIVRNLIAVGVKPTRIVIHERGGGQILLARYEQFVPQGVRIESANTWLGYDPDVYVEANFFGEDDTRSYLIRMVSEQFTKIINVPNMKDHSASGVTGCLKNLGYGTFNNVARSHRSPFSFTDPLIGVMCSVEPLRSKAVLHIMDGMRQVWHGGPLTQVQEFIYQAGILFFGTDPVAMDTVELDAIEKKRREEGVPSLWEHNAESITTNGMEFYHNPRKNLFYRRPGHIASAGSLGLGVADLKRIDHGQIRLG